MSQLSVLTVREMEIKMNYVEQNTFEFANKPRKWLAYKLGKEKGNRLILSYKEEIL